jgi:phenylacetate-CoA ligase
MNTLEILFHVAVLQRNVHKTRKEIKKLQEKKLRKILHYAYEHSPYYRKAFESHGICREDIDKRPLSDFPTIDKAELIQNFDEIVTNRSLKQEDIVRFDATEQNESELYQKCFHIVHSSGSTQRPAYFVYAEKAWKRLIAGIVRAAFWKMTFAEIVRFLIKKPKVLYIAATDGRYGGAMAVGDGITGLQASQLFLDINEPVEQWVQKLETFHPDMVIGYPSAIKILGKLTEENEIRMNPQRVITCGEPLGRNLRQYFEKTFHTEIINIYGSSESLALGVEADRASGMQLFDDLNVMEILDDGVYLTTLYNRTQPLIRYRISDKLTPGKATDDEGCFTTIQSVDGRDEDILWFTDENGKRDFLHPLAVEGFCIEGLIDYQLCQTGSDSFEIRMQLQKALLEKEAEKTSVQQKLREQMLDILQHKQMQYVRFTLKTVEEILPDPKTGKKRLVVNN